VPLFLHDAKRDIYKIVILSVQINTNKLLMLIFIQCKNKRDKINISNNLSSIYGSKANNIYI